MKDNFSKQADTYAKYRPTYPQELFDFIFSHIKKMMQHGTVVQVTGKLLRNFQNNLKKCLLPI